ncbi:recombinase family protein [Chitinophaga terrae (ex Kim and Jung 2007)]|uniref:recombinase family protein n=1 Tax=Chitinophaga terrae (ex Kim and Jung 2007) TaxID=408074 RepID=UPI000ACE77C9|nr:recombinase family protein [Chitinophaga terrae (ex Kim and Jung 2007)]GEP93273.1 resolvase [Chitinophaga terrae (ex Kim and Jung 2007)]
MITADLYIRVSTDEQADKGYSQRDQDERLQRHCQQQGIIIRKIIYEDHSAKSFNRPEWKKMLTEYKGRSRSKPNLILFTKWDRFSRKAADAYAMIGLLNTYGVEPRAIEQPLDLSVPESKVILAIYLATPEVENDRRSLNVISGMRRARKEGRYMGVAPFGYKNRITENHEKYIAVHPENAALVRWVFEEIAANRYNTHQIWRMAQKKGFKRSLSQFWRLIQNPVYMGKIFIHAFKNEEEMVVDGLHEPLISEALFYEVQDLLMDRSKTKPVKKAKVVSDKCLPLRNFLICPDCGGMLTGSASLGRQKDKSYHYYHCRNKCKARFKADELNLAFEEHLRKLVPTPETANLFRQTVMSAVNGEVSGAKSIKSQLLDEIQYLTDKIAKARDLLIAGDLEPEDFKAIKNDCGRKIVVLEARVTEVQTSRGGIDKTLDQALKNLTKLYFLYKHGSIIQKRRIIDWTYPENMLFDGTNCPNGNSNPVIKLISALDADLAENKNGTSNQNDQMYRKVEVARVELASKHNRR